MLLKLKAAGPTYIDLQVVVILFVFAGLIKEVEAIKAGAQKGHVCLLFFETPDKLTDHENSTVKWVY